MKAELVQAFMMKNGECFDPMVAQEVQRQLSEADDSKAAYFMSLSLQNPTLILILAIFTGWERFFLGDVAMGILKLITCYGCGIWWIIDIFSAKSRTLAYNYQKFQQTLLICK